MILGFTGTRENLTDAQIGWLFQRLEDADQPTVHHGACVGADQTVHAAALDTALKVHVWPPTNMKLVATECLTPHPWVIVHPRMPYFNRNREIVNAAQQLVALPKHEEQPGPMNWGGTWYTVDFAQRMNKRVTICYPSGRVEVREKM
jgi:hypothetical protein